MKKRVVVTGMGIISPVGNNVADAWNNIQNGRSGISKITRYDMPSLKTQIAGEVKNFDPSLLIDQKEIKKMDSFIHYALFAAEEAVQDSGLEITDANGMDVGVSIGVGIGGLPMIEKYAQILHTRGPSRISPFFIPMSITNMASGHISIRHGAKNYNATTTSACSSSNHSFAASMRMIQYGDAKVMIAGGSEGTVCSLAIAGFGALKALSTRNDEPEKASRPYDKSRDGFVLSEGCGVLILEELEHAQARGAKIYCELLGGASTSDAFHITAPSIDGPCSAMELALKDSKINTDQIDYINTHGTSTPLGDINEIKAIKKCFGTDDSKKLSISSTKSMTGHLLGGAGGVEAIFSIMAMKEGIIPPTINIDELDEECDLDVTPNVAKERNVDVCMSNSFGFGGTNCTLVFKKFQE